MELTKIVGHLDSFLRVKEIADSSLNGLQVETARDVTRVAVGVDASLDTFAKANEAGAELIVVHHGLIWDKVAITGSLYRRVRYLIENGLGLYAAHLPLDMHPEVGNNAQLARLIGLRGSRPFLEYKGSFISVVGDIDRVSIEDFARTVERAVGPVTLLRHGPSEVSRVAICSGGGGPDLEQAVREGADVYLTGETSHQASTIAKDAGINVIFAGHYWTETLGPRALAKHIEDSLGLPAVFVASPTGF